MSKLNFEDKLKLTKKFMHFDPIFKSSSLAYAQGFYDGAIFTYLLISDALAKEIRLAQKRVGKKLRREKVGKTGAGLG